MIEKSFNYTFEGGTTTILEVKNDLGYSAETDSEYCPGILYSLMEKDSSTNDYVAYSGDLVSMTEDLQLIIGTQIGFTKSFYIEASTLSGLSKTYLELAFTVCG